MTGWGPSRISAGTVPRPPAGCPGPSRLRKVKGILSLGSTNSGLAPSTAPVPTQTEALPGRRAAPTRSQSRAWIPPMAWFSGGVLLWTQLALHRPLLIHPPCILRHAGRRLGRFCPRLCGSCVRRRGLTACPLEACLLPTVAVYPAPIQTDPRRAGIRVYVWGLHCGPQALSVPDPIRGVSVVPAPQQYEAGHDRPHGVAGSSNTREGPGPIGASEP